jgi:hypothetical protein
MLCEGKHDAAFFRHLIKHHNIPSFQVTSLSDLSDRKLGWKEALNAIIASPGIDTLKSILIVSDNDDNPERRFSEICKAIKYSEHRPGPPPLKLSAPTGIRQKSDSKPAVMVMMIPWDNEKGELATLCYEAVEKAHVKKARCVSRFVDCVNANGWPTAKVSKLKLSTYLATYKRNPLIPFHCVWNEDDPLIPLESEAYNRVIQFLRGYKDFLKD